nr:DUF1294 domain-containing protein [Paraferrimonas sedimenticola]
MSRLPIAILGFYLLVSLVTFLSYGLDKRAAKKGKRRTPERRLHLLALAGGWPGAWLAQKYYRHKTQKTEFRFMFWLTVLFNLGALMWMQTADGQRLFVSLF